MTVFSYDVLKDLTRLEYPMPVLHTRSALMKLESGKILKVILENPESADEIHKVCQSSGHLILKCFESESKFVFWIEKK